MQRIRIIAAAFIITTLAHAQPRPAAPGPLLAKAALGQVGVTRLYDPAYRPIAYPGGDVPMDRGVCSDVVIRAFRSIGVDLQVELHADLRRNFRSYPQMWGLSRPDTNIDHRRVPNLMTFFKRKGRALPVIGSYLPGDVVAWRLSNGLHHIGVVSASRTLTGRPLVVHNIGQGAQLEDVLDRWEKIGHYRW